ncbi:NlpC/P60 family protein [Atlantibacter subterranea]|uniref:NlpC/P60 family protein n=1 Tax=Atlantibacter subterraneus TaxID=255519 RepID=UPI0020C4748F|nr:NlpC/P60 family protein [Atlantibacter subterranea]UTJ45604.1 NlpC/P60 family protein [Atlantibacter subterranea]
MRMWIIVIATLLLAGCGHHHAPPPNARLSDSITVIAELNDQLRTWHGTPYRYGGMSRHGVDCSAFVLVTFRDRFALRLPRQTSEQAEIGTRIDKDDLLPGDLVFFKTGSGENGLHVGIYDTDNQFIHASTSQGVIKSSLDNVYWNKKFWQARRI